MWRGRRSGRGGWGSLAGFADDGQFAADRDGVVLVGDDLGQYARGRGGDLGVNLVGGDLQQWLIGHHGVALLLEPAGDGSLGDTLTECGHLDGDGHAR